MPGLKWNVRNPKHREQMQRVVRTMLRRGKPFFTCINRHRECGMEPDGACVMQMTVLQKGTGMKEGEAVHSMQLTTAFGALMIQFINKETINVMSATGMPVTFFGIEWDVWLMLLKDCSGEWMPGHSLGSLRADGVSRRVDRQKVSDVAEAKIRNAIIDAVNQLGNDPAFIASLTAADRRSNMQYMVNLQAQKLHLEAELDALVQQIKQAKKGMRK